MDRFTRCTLVSTFRNLKEMFTRCVLFMYGGKNCSKIPLFQHIFVKSLKCYQLDKVVVQILFTINTRTDETEFMHTNSTSFSSSFSLFDLLFPTMARLVFFFYLLVLTFLLFEHPGSAATCTDCFIRSRAAHYPNSDNNGTENGQCGYGTFGATINGGDVSAASDLYRNGVGCGACYQVRCTNGYYCSDKGVTIVITDHGASDSTDFILSRRAFGQMGQNADAAASLLALGVVDVEYKRVPCSYPNENIAIKIVESSNNPHYLAFVIWYQQGKKDITAVQLCETQNYVCKLLDRTYGAVWTTVSPPSGPLSVRMLFSDENGDEEWVVPVKDIPKNWKGGDTYDTGVQVINA